MIATCDHKTIITANPGTPRLFDFSSLTLNQISINVIIFCISKIDIVQTVQPPLSDHPNYEDLVVAYENRTARIFFYYRSKHRYENLVREIPKSRSV